MKREYNITDSQVVKRAKEAVRIEIEKQKAMDNPIVIYDGETGNIYHENSDGSRSVIGRRLYEGRYSERRANPYSLKYCDEEIETVRVKPVGE